MANSMKRHDLSKLEAYPPEIAYSAYQDGGDEIELRDYWRILVKRKWLIFAVLASVLAGVALQTLTTTPIYRSTINIRIDPESGNVLPYKDVGETSESYLVTDTYLQTQYRTLESRSLASRVIERLNLRKDPVFNEEVGNGFFVEAVSLLQSTASSVLSPLSPKDSGAANEGEQDLIKRFLKNLKVNPIRQSRLVEVDFLSHDPKFAAKVVNKLAEEFIEQNFENKYEATIRATDFLQKQLQDLKIKVESSEEQLIQYGRRHGILNIDDRENIVLQKLADMNQEMTKVQADVIGKTARYQVVKDASVENFPHSLKTGLIIDLEKQLFQLEQQLANLFARFGPEWPEVQRVQQEIEKVKMQLQRERELAIQNAKIEYEVTRDHYQRVLQALEEQKRLAEQLNEDSIQYNILKREVETTKQLYEGLLQRLKEAGVSAGLKSSNIQVLDRGVVPTEIYRPRTALNLSLGLVVGLMLSVGLVFFVEYLDNTVKTPDQLEQFLTISSLGVVPTIQSSDHAYLPTDTTDAIIPYASTPTGSRVWEAYRSLRTSILLSSSGQQPKVILVTSAFSGEGKTTTASNMGIVFAQTGARTLLIDLDMRKPKLAKVFGVNGGGGMSTFLSGNSDLSSQIQQTSVPNLFVLPAGPIPPNPAELMSSDRMEEALGLLVRHFKYVVLDSPPVLSVTDALVLSPRADGVVLVVQGGKTPRDAVRKASTNLEQVGAKILGAIINNVNIESSEYYYYYRHYYDYGYHKSESGDQAG